MAHGLHTHTDHVDWKWALLHDGVCGGQQTDVQHCFLGIEILRTGRVRAARVLMHAVLNQCKHSTNATQATAPSLPLVTTNLDVTETLLLIFTMDVCFQTNLSCCLVSSINGWLIILIFLST